MARAKGFWKGVDLEDLSIAIGVVYAVHAIQSPVRPALGRERSQLHQVTWATAYSRSQLNVVDGHLYLSKRFLNSVRRLIDLILKPE